MTGDAVSDTTLIYQTREDMAEIKGMLGVFVGDINARVNSLETALISITTRVNDKGKTLATHTEQILSNKERIDDIEDNNDARTGKVFGLIGALGAAVATIITVYNTMRGN